jgi:predicted dienelactone hydrolase
MRRILLIGLLTAGLVSTAQGERRYPVGVTDRAFLKDDASYDWRGAKTHALLTTVWYPAANGAHETAQWVGEPGHPFAAAGKAAREAKPAGTPRKFPLILLSHGTGGSALMMAWLGTELAAHGYIAAAVNHPGNNALETYTVQGFTLGWERAEDLSKVLDGMLADPLFGTRIDAKRIGAAGFSFGGYTMMELAGGIGDINRLVKLCSSGWNSNGLCDSPTEFPDLMQKALALIHTDPKYAEAMARSAETHRDPRIKAVFAIAPPLAGVFSMPSLAAISIPVRIVAGQGDPIVPPDRNARLFAAHIPGAVLTIYPGSVGHYTFLDTCTEAGKMGSPQLCVDPVGVNRKMIHADASGQAVGFFDQNL